MPRLRSAKPGCHLLHPVSAVAYGRGVSLAASGRCRSRASIDAEAAAAATAQEPKVSAEEMFTNWVPSMGPSASPVHHDNPIVAM